MKKIPARFVLAIVATLVLVLTCYGLARAYLYYEAARAERMMRELGDVNIGDSEAQVLPILERYGTRRRFLEPYVGSNRPTMNTWLTSALQASTTTMPIPLTPACS